MSVKATVTYTNGSQAPMLMAGWDELALWMASHWGQYIGITGELIQKEDETHEPEPSTAPEAGQTE